MKKHYKTMLLLLLPFCCHLCSCEENTLRINAMEAGTFVGVDSKGNYQCTLVVEEISKDEYAKADGINVVLDVVGKGYYRLDFKAASGDVVVTYDFDHLEDPYDGSPRTFACYRDANKAWVEPWNPHYPTETHRDHVDYDVSIRTENIEISVNLTWQE